MPFGFFLQTYNISNNGKNGIRNFTTWNQKSPVAKCYSWWGLNPGLRLTSHEKSNTIWIIANFRLDERRDETHQAVISVNVPTLFMNANIHDMTDGYA